MERVRYSAVPIHGGRTCEGIRSDAPVVPIEKIEEQLLIQLGTPSKPPS